VQRGIDCASVEKVLSYPLIVGALAVCEIIVAPPPFVVLAVYVKRRVLI
jgi:hypothetical protein